MEVNVTIGGGQKMTLTGAVLVYRGGNDAFAVWHPAKPGTGGGVPYLGEAESLTTEFLRTLSAGDHVAPEILPAKVWFARQSYWFGGQRLNVARCSSVNRVKRERVSAANATQCLPWCSRCQAGAYGSAPWKGTSGRRRRRS
jgi:hypothetical protein